MQVDIFSPDLHANPYPIFAALRAHAPAHLISYPGGQQVWLISRYDDVATVLKDRRFVTDPRRLDGVAPPAPPSQLAKLFARAMLSFDPPDHTRLRRLVQLAFTPRIVEGMRPRVQAIADALIDRMEGRGQIDLVAAYATPLPMTVITELLGVPEEREQFQDWFDLFSEMIFEPGHMQRQEAAAVLFVARLHELFAQRRAAPLDDLLTALVQAEEGSDRLSEDELLSMTFLLSFAGYETTRNLIGSSVLVLLEHPDQLARLRADPALIPAALEELLRYTSPAQGTTVRIATADIELGGVVIPRGGRVLAVLGSANYDERRFADPARFDISRAECPHMAFGSGIHHCLGAPLARLEGAVALETLLRRLPGIRLAIPPDQLEWRPSFFIRGLARLPLLV